ncbi:MAG: glycosyltransferase family 2 protein [Chitinispirillales bacterium]|jgi:cellulose synthase/poly-beta-1,6-N-acetylglucosamine synthase-like glycosyltransferase|nr:glycosyltransferase family 2 protein [Chitinispirillales bacterium]
MLLVFKTVFWLSFGVIVYSYFLYPCFLIIFARLFGRPANTGDDDYLPEIGVLVPAYNEEKVIKHKIESILSMDYPADKLSVWVGSDCSDDATDEIVKGISDPRVRLWRSERRGGKTGVINELTPQISSEIILFTDANTMHRKDCLRVMVKHFADPQVGGVAGHIEHKASAENENAETVYRSFESRQKFLEGQLHSSISAFGGFYAIRNKLFRPIPRNAYSNDDVLIPMNIIRQGYRIIYDLESVSEEDMTDKVSSEFQRRVRIGAGNFQSFFWLLDFFNPLRGWPCFCYISHKVTRWFSPFFILFCLISCLGVVMLGGSQMYKFLLSCGIIFSISGLLYHQVPLRMNRHIFYFFAMNLALLLGSIRFAGGIKSAVWKRTERA